MFGLTVLTRLPGLVSSRLYNVDESYLAAMGLTIGGGGRLYVDAVDRKPPVLPWLYAVSRWVLGTVDLRFMRFLVVLAVAGAAVAVVALVLRLGGTRSGATAGGALLVLGTVAFPPADGQAANFELFALLPASAAVLTAVSARTASPRGRLLRLALAGVLVGVAGMIKQPFFVMLAPVGWEVLHARRRWVDRISGGVTVLAGTVVAVVLVGLPFGLGDVWHWAWVETGDYLDGEVGGIRAVGVLVTVLVAFGVTHLPVLAPAWLGRHRLRLVDSVVWWWMAGAVIAIIPGFRFIVHYFQLLVPPLALLAGLLLSWADERARRWSLAAAGVIAAICVVIAALPVSDAGRVGSELVHAIQQRSEPNERVLVWGALPEVYWRSERLPGPRFLSVGYITGKWADRPKPPRHPERIRPYRSRWPVFDQDLRDHPPKLVIDMTTSDLDGWTAYSPEQYPFGEVLRSCYEKVDVVEKMQIWELTDPACVPATLDAHAG